MARYAPDAVALARGVGFVPAATFDAPGAPDATALRAAFERDAAALRRQSPQAWLAFTVHERVLAKLRREAVEDFRIDFEDGYGARPDADEDATAVAAAGEVARGLAEGLLPPFIGIRIKSFGAEWQARGARTLEIFVDTLLTATGGRLPDNFVVTLPKVTIAEQPRTLVRLCERLEARHGLPAGALRIELMIETTQALLGPDGRSPLPAFLDACEGRCRGAHLGTYDFTASCNITAAYQSMDHPWCDLAKGMMMLAYAGTGIFLSDGATNVMPVGPHRGDALTRRSRSSRTAPSSTPPGSWPTGTSATRWRAASTRAGTCTRASCRSATRPASRSSSRASPRPPSGSATSSRRPPRPRWSATSSTTRRPGRGCSTTSCARSTRAPSSRATSARPASRPTRSRCARSPRSWPRAARACETRLIRRNLHDVHELETAASPATC